MNYVKMLGLLAVAAAALMAIGGTAAASILTSPAGTTYTGEIVATSTNMKYDTSFTTVECEHSELIAEVEQDGAYKAGGRVVYLNFAGCTHPITIKRTGTFEVTTAGTITSRATEVEIHTSVGTCILTTHANTGTTLGILTEGSGATWDINSSSIPRTGGTGSFFCGSSWTWTGSYTFTKPSSLLVD